MNKYRFLIEVLCDECKGHGVIDLTDNGVTTDVRCSYCDAQGYVQQYISIPDLKELLAKDDK